MSSQLESHHFFRLNDRVEHLDGRQGFIVEAFSLYAVVDWGWGVREEIEQFVPDVFVIERDAGAQA